MNHIVLVRYGEIALKSKPVRREFEDALISNIKSVLDKIPHKIETVRGRIFIDTSKPEKVSEIVSNIPGVVSTSPAHKTEASMDNISRTALEIFEKYFGGDVSFAVRARRTGNHEFTSQDVGEIVGAKIADKFPKIRVDLNDPDREIFIEVRENNAYLFTEKKPGIGGLPVNTQGKVVSLYTGSIKSLLSTYLILKRGTNPHLIFPNLKNGGKKLDLALEFARKLLKFHPKMKLFSIPFKSIKEEISEASEKLRWILCQRIYFRLGEITAKRIGGNAIVSEASMEDLSSYSLEYIRHVEEEINYPVLYPLSGLGDKEVKAAKERINISGEDFNPPEPCPFQSPKSKKVNISEIRKAERNISKERLIKSAFEDYTLHELEA